MYNIFYIYTYKYTKPSNTLTRSRFHALNTYANRHRINSSISYARSQAQDRKLFIYGKMQKPHNAPSYTISNLHICGDFEKLHNAFCISVLSLFCNHIENVLWSFCNLWAKWAYTCVGKLKNDVIRAHTRPKALAL